MDSNSIDDMGNTPLHLAADLGRARVARVLLDAAADPNATNNFCQRPIDKAQTNSWDSETIRSGKHWIRRMFDGVMDPVDSLPPEDWPKLTSAAPQCPQRVSQTSAARGASGSSKGPWNVS